MKKETNLLSGLLLSAGWKMLIETISNSTIGFLFQFDLCTSTR